jgi:hypothetical protein
MVRLQQSTTPVMPGLVGPARGLLIAAALLGGVGAATAQAPPDARVLAVRAATAITAAGNAPTALAVFFAARSRALWGDWPRGAEAEVPEIPPALDPEFLRSIKDLRTPSPRERRAIEEIIVLASQTSARAFASGAGENQDVTVAQLLQSPRQFRGEVVRVEGRLQRLRNLPPSAWLKQQGVKRLYECLLEGYARGSSPVLVLISSLPAGIKPGRPRGDGVIVDGYFVKKHLERGKDPRVALLLVSHTLTRTRGPLPKEKTPDRAPPIAHLLTGVQDAKRAPSAERNLPEFLAYCDTIVVATRTPEAALENSGRQSRSAAYVQMIKDPAAYRGQVIHVQGRLALLRRWRVPAFLARKGVRHVYEGWVFGKGSNPFCVVFTELPPGIKVGEEINYPVKFDGYFFKVLRYTAVKKDRLAPLLIGRTIRSAVPANRAGLGKAFSLTFVVCLSVLIGGTVFLVVGLSWWFRRGDRKLRSRLARAHPEPVFEPVPGEDAEMWGPPPSGHPGETAGGDRGVQRNGH